jgi:RHS repeat-associated protein
MRSSQRLSAAGFLPKPKCLQQQSLTHRQSAAKAFIEAPRPLGSDATGENPIPYGFVGERSHPTGLYWLRARWYVPSHGAFLTRDKANDHPYTYAGGNPVRLSDPSGKSFAGTLSSSVVTVAVIASLATLAIATFFVATQAPPAKISLPRPRPGTSPTLSPLPSPARSD